MLTARDAAESVPQYRAIFEAVETQFPGASDRERFDEGLRQLIDGLVSGLVEGTVESARQADVADAEAVRAYPRRIAAFTEETARTSQALKRFLHARVYSTTELGEGRQRSMAMIAALFQFFLDHPDRLPQPYADRAGAEPPHRVICDYIAGMTDAFCHRTFDQIAADI